MGRAVHAVWGCEVDSVVRPGTAVAKVGRRACDVQLAVLLPTVPHPSPRRRRLFVARPRTWYSHEMSSRQCC